MEAVRPSRARSWGAGLLCAGLGALAFRELLWFQPERSLPEELEAWFFVPSDTITPIVVLLALWLLYRRAAWLRALPARGGSTWGGVLLLLLACSLYGWATYTRAADLLVPSLMLYALAGAWLWKGPAAMRAVAVPVAFLVFAMPLPAPLLNQLIYRLQIGTAEAAGGILYLLDVPHFVAGERIVRTHQTFSVIEACSGLRSMETLTMVAILMVDLFRRPPLHAWIVVLVAPPVAFALNGLRAVALILNPNSAVATIHNAQGVAILLTGLVLLFLLDGLLERLPSRARSGAPAGSSGPPRRAPVLPLLAGALALAAAASLWLPRWEEEPRPHLELSEHFAAALGGGLSRELPVDRLFLGSTGFRESFNRLFTGGADPVYLFLGLGDRSLRQRSALSPKTGLPGSGWIVEEEGTATLEPDGREVRAEVLRSGSERRLVYHWYENDLPWGEELLRAATAVDRSPWREGRQILALRLETLVVGSIREGRPAAEQVLVSFYRDLRPLLDRLKAEIAEGAGDGGKRFSSLDGMGKTFSVCSGTSECAVLSKNSYLGIPGKSAWDLLSVEPGSQEAPGGSERTYLSLGWRSTGTRKKGQVSWNIPLNSGLMPLDGNTEENNEMKVSLMALLFGLFLAAGFPLAAMAGPNPGGSNSDGDSVEDAFDNCVTTDNQDQADTNHDGCGDACSTASLDADGTNDGIVGGPDYLLWLANFNGVGTTKATGDYTGDGVTGGPDYLTWLGEFNNQWGPSGHPASQRAENCPGL